VSHWRTHLALCVNVVVFAVLAGCNRGGDGSQSPAAAIGGPDSTSPATGGGNGSSPQKPASDPKHPVVEIETSMGKITVQLDAEKSRLTAENFLSYVGAGHYDQTIIHQVYKGQGFLAGGYGTNLIEKPSGVRIVNEANNGVKNKKGTVSMVRFPDLIDSATCQFFVNVVDNPALDYRDNTPEGFGYCVFGAVSEGMDVVDRIAAVEVRDTPEFEHTPVQPIVVTSIKQIR
jgi:peptidyl-prolyl cis-trans isomerase B (cyclophilin B)